MTTGKIHEIGGPKTPTADQMRVARALADEGRYVYLEKGQGKQVVSAFRRFLESGDAQKITPALYHFLMQRCGFIAHYDIHGFRGTYADPADLLDRSEEGGPLMFSGGFMDEPMIRGQEHVFTDGMTVAEVWAGMRKVAVLDGLRAQARLRREKCQEALELATLRMLAEKHGLTVS